MDPGPICWLPDPVLALRKGIRIQSMTLTIRTLSEALPTWRGDLRALGEGMGGAGAVACKRWRSGGYHCTGGAERFAGATGAWCKHWECS